MLANLLAVSFRHGLVHHVGAVRGTRELLVQRAACKLAPIETRGLLAGVVAEAGGDHLLAVRGAEIETVGGLSVAQVLLLEFHDLHNGLVEGLEHVGDGILLFPRILLPALCKIGDVQSGGVLRVGATQHVAVGVVAEQIGHVAADVVEVGDGAVVHEDVASKDKGMRVHLSHDAARCGADVGEQTIGFSVTAEIAEIEIADRRRLRLVQSRSLTLDALDVAFGSAGIEGHTKAVHVQQAVAHLEQSIFGIIELVFFSVGQKLGEVVL